MRPRRIGRPRSMHDGQMPLVPQRLQRPHRRMQPKEPIQIDHRVLRNPNIRPVLVVRRLPIRHHHIQPIRRPALEDDNEPLALRSRSLRHHTPRQESRNRRRPNDSHRPAPHKSASRQRRKHPRHPRLHSRLHYRPMHGLIPGIVTHERLTPNPGYPRSPMNKQTPAPRRRLFYKRCA